MPIHRSLVPDVPIPVEDTGPLFYFDTVREAFARASAQVGQSIEQVYTIGGQIVRFIFAGEALVPLITPSLEHLRALTKFIGAFAPNAYAPSADVTQAFPPTRNGEAFTNSARSSNIYE